MSEATPLNSHQQNWAEQGQQEIILRTWKGKGKETQPIRRTAGNQEILKTRHIVFFREQNIS